MVRDKTSVYTRQLLCVTPYFLINLSSHHNCQKSLTIIMGSFLSSLTPIHSTHIHIYVYISSSLDLYTYMYIYRVLDSYTYICFVSSSLDLYTYMYIYRVLDSYTYICIYIEFSRLIYIYMYICLVHSRYP